MRPSEVSVMFMFWFVILSLFFFLLFLSVSFSSLWGTPAGSVFVIDKFSFFFFFLSFVSFVIVYLKMISENVHFTLSSNSAFCIFFPLFLLFLSDKWLFFFFFFEVCLLCTFYLIVSQGSNPERIAAGLYLMAYSIMGSFPLFMKILSITFMSSTKFFFPLSGEDWTPDFLGQEFYYFFFWHLAFLVKLPFFGGHLWLPKAHVESPTFGSVVLAAVLLKIGVFGILRTNLKFSWGSNFSFILFFCWAVLSLIFSSLICFRKTDAKALMAYSSVAHMGLVVASFLFMKKITFFSFILLSLGHGFISSSLFSGFSFFYKNSGSRKIFLLFGALKFSPLFVFFWAITALGNFSFPPSAKFFAEVSVFVKISGFCASLFILPFFVLFVFFKGLFSLSLFQWLSLGKSVLQCSFKAYFFVDILCLFLNVFWAFFLIFLAKKTFA